MLRMYCLQQRYGKADEALDDALFHCQALRDTVGIDLSRESAPDAAAQLASLRLLLASKLTKALFDESYAHLAERELLIRAGSWPARAAVERRGPQALRKQIVVRNCARAFSCR